MRTAIILGANLVVATVALVWVFWRLGGPALALLAAAPSVPLLAAFVGTVAAAVTSLAWRWRVVLGGLGTAPGLAVLTAYRLAGQSLSTLIPSGKLGGEPLRVWLLRDRAVPLGAAIASVVVDRTLEMGAAIAFACLFAAILVQHGIPALQGLLVTMLLGAVGLAVGVIATVRRLRRGAGLVTAVVRRIGLDRFGIVQGQVGTMAAAETDTVRLIDQPRRIGRAFAVGIVANLLVLLEYWLLLSAFELPSTPIAVVAAIFATGAAHSMPVPAGIGVLEGGQMWLFGLLGYPSEVGLAVALAVRMRELLWVVPGLIFLALRALGRVSAATTADRAGEEARVERA
ncbi:MAG TPA: lysylphosphatidylglycerol synthase transmembrane domain-containing protein [Candidatus Binatia bacterium]|nr:lysylphosphatidylglycerol synthase transmembrane domain-containing protein [Candidatus Binatia bacterium]